MSVKTLYGCLLATLVVLMVVPKCSGGDPKRCCSPDVWEARMVNIGASRSAGRHLQDVDARFAYDLPNNRWALDHVHRTDPSKNLKFVFDFKRGKRVAIVDKGCFQEVLDVGLNPYCIPKNATYLGEFVSGLPNHALTYQAWSYDIFMYPLRQTVVVSSKTCIPIKETDWSLVQNTYGWTEGEPACIPWEDPDIVKAGECYKSFKKVEKEYFGTQPTGFYLNFDFVDTNLTITDESIFDVPDHCSDKSWFGNVWTSDFTRILIMRMKYFDEEKDAIIF